MSPEVGGPVSALCKRYGARLLDDHSRTGGTRTRGLWAIINYGIELASSDFVCWLNDDCVVHEGWDATALSYFSPRVGLVVLRTKGINQDPEYGIRGGYLGIPVANYAILRKSTGIRFDERYSWFYGDADLPLEMARRTDWRIVGTNEGLVVHNHRVDSLRQENESDPRVREDHRFFDRKWKYFKRVGDRVVKMNALETVQAAVRHAVRETYLRIRSPRP